MNDTWGKETTTATMNIGDGRLGDLWGESTQAWYRYRWVELFFSSYMSSIFLLSFLFYPQTQLFYFVLYVVARVRMFKWENLEYKKKEGEFFYNVFIYYITAHHHHRRRHLFVVDVEVVCIYIELIVVGKIRI